MGIDARQARWTAEPGPALWDITVGDLLDQQTRLNPAHPFLVCRDDESALHVRFTLAEFQARVDSFACGLLALGIAPGDTVGVLATNRPEWLIANFALPKIGAVLVTVNTHVRQGELGHVLQQGQLRALILQRAHRGNPYLDHLRAWAPQLADPEALLASPLPAFRHAILVGEEPGTVPETGTLTFERVEAMGSSVPREALATRQAAVKPGDVWQIQFTSGTTGAPKGAMLTHRATVNNARLFCLAAGIRPEDTLVSAMPLFHAAGNIVEVLGLLALGGTLIKAAAFEPGWMLQLIHEERPTVLAGVPTMLIGMLNHPRFLAGDFDTRSLRLLIGGGTAMPLRVLERLQQELGTEAQLGFGMTELSPMVSCTQLGDELVHKSDSVGRPLPHLDVCIVADDGRTCAHDEPGELLVRGFSVMAGYYRQPEATQQTIDAEGWLHTGDLAALSADGTLRIVGRLKDMFKRGGENVYPVEVENFLMSHPQIAQAQVVGVPDERMGEEGAAFIQPRPGEGLSLDDVRAFCRQHMARHKLPKYFRVVDAFPLTPSGKVRKVALREGLMAELSRSDPALKVTP